MRTSRAGWLSYLGGWVTGLVLLLLKREDRLVRFHAMQSLIFFGAMSMATTVFNHIPLLGSIGSGLALVPLGSCNSNSPSMDADRSLEALFGLLGRRRKYSRTA